MSHSKCSVTEEMELITSTQYVMSGSTPDILKGGSQVRERVEFEAVIFSKSMAEGCPNKNIQFLLHNRMQPN